MTAVFRKFGSRLIGMVCYDPSVQLPLTNIRVAVAFGLYHFACIMLHSFKPGPRFAIRSVGSLLNTDVKYFTPEQVFVLTFLSAKFWIMHGQFVVHAGAHLRLCHSR